MFAVRGGWQQDAGRPLSFLSARFCTSTLAPATQVSLADLQAVAASLQTAAPLLGLPVISAAGATQQRSALALASLAGINLFRCAAAAVDCLPPLRAPSASPLRECCYARGLAPPLAPIPNLCPAAAAPAC